MKRLWILLSVMLVLVLVGCTQQEQESMPQVTDEATSEEAVAEEATTEEALVEEVFEEETTSGDEELLLTLEELKAYNGQEGKPAYVAVDGIIYDMTDVKAWSGGKHKGNQAGQDLTDVIKNQSPHGVKNLENVPVVGKLVSE